MDGRTSRWKSGVAAADSWTASHAQCGVCTGSDSGIFGDSSNGFHNGSSSGSTGWFRGCGKQQWRNENLGLTGGAGGGAGRLLSAAMGIAGGAGGAASDSGLERCRRWWRFRLSLRGNGERSGADRWCRSPQNYEPVGTATGWKD